MAVSRPLLLALLGLVLSAATLVAARGAGDTAADPGSAPVEAAVTPTPISPDPAKSQAEKKSPAKADPGKANVEPGSRDKPRAADRGDRATARPNRPRAAPLPEGVPAPVGRALRDRRVVVLFFAQGGADDDATADAVDGLRGLQGVSIFRDGIGRLARYRSVVSDLGVAQAPAVVIVGPDRKAQLVEGFVDPGTLEQLVLDAR